jgi:hypothetical protein
MAKTSGGLNKRNYQFTDTQLARIRQVAGERHIPHAAAVRELIELGIKVYDRAHPVSQPLEAMAVDAIAREVA